MKKIINGEDILMALGELPEELLSVKEHTKPNNMLMHKISTVAACFIIAIGVFSALYLGLFGKFKPAMDGSSNPPGNSQIENTDDGKNSSPDSAFADKIHNHIIFDYEGNLLSHNERYGELDNKNPTLIKIKSQGAAPTVKILEDGGVEVRTLNVELKSGVFVAEVNVIEEMSLLINIPGIDEPIIVKLTPNGDKILFEVDNIQK